MARVSVIITTYNREKLLPRAIASVKDCGADTEIIVVDDASTDGTRELCEELEGIRYIRMETNQGTAAARNAGIRNSTSDIIAFLDDDDSRLPGTLELQARVLEKDASCALVYGKVFYADQNLQLTGESNMHQPTYSGDVTVELLKQNFITLSSVVARKSYIVSEGLFDVSRKMLGLEDWDLWLRLSTRYQVIGLPDPVAIYRRPEKNSGQWYSDPGRQYSLAAKAYQQKWFHLPGIKEKFGSEFSRVKKQILTRTSDIIIYSAVHNSTSKAQQVARLASAVKCWPRNLLQLRFYKGLIKSMFQRTGLSILHL